MTRDIIDINDFTILVETATSEHITEDICAFDEPVIGIAFYGAGNVQLDVLYNENKQAYQHTKGLALSFYADERVQFKHTVDKNQPLECLVVVTAVSSLQHLPNQEGEIFTEVLHQLVHPQDHYVEGPEFFMNPKMMSVVEDIFNNSFSGKNRMLFFRSQVTALLSHFFGHVATEYQSPLTEQERLKLIEAQQILLSDLEHPPSLSELAHQIGWNTFKLKKNFKAWFGLPVFKYLQNERLTKAHALISQQKMTIQEAAWEVGYDSLSSFSNAFAKKFGFRPSQLK
ncbi:MAG: AraC family transcriptional regulator [Saprospiraceae bacterium]|nr:AraC family transcriptional regulator [Saprospiraceae bacterium]